MSAQIAVLLPFRDAAATVIAAAESILEERATDLELLAIDDGSCDDGPTQLAALAQRDQRLHVLRSEGRGISAALTTGFRASSAPLVARMDADDLSVAPRLSLQAEVLRSRPGLAAVGAQVEAFPEAHVAEGMERYVAWQNSLVTEEDHRRELFVESPLCHPSVMMRRSALVAVGGYADPPWPEDYDLWLRFDAAGYGLAKVPRPLLRWRHSGGRLTFSDPRYHEERFREAKAHYLAPKLRNLDRPLTIWGAGPTGRRFARALEPHGIRPRRFVDIDPKKIGGTARGAPIEAASVLDAQRDYVLVSVGARGARALVRQALGERGFSESADFRCVA